MNVIFAGASTQTQDVAANHDATEIGISALPTNGFPKMPMSGATGGAPTSTEIGADEEIRALAAKLEAARKAAA